jgi:peptidyl-tRNA hydrolase, PTH1 family
MLIVAGLGNPGPKHARQRHNIGFMAVDAIAALHRFGPWRTKFQAQLSEGVIGGQKILLIKPQTFMNRSGDAITGALRFYKREPKDLVVCYDDLDLAPGKLRVKQGGGHGGHNGLRSIDSHIGPNYWRVRMGIGHPGDKAKVHNYVLGDFSKTEETWLVPLLASVAQEFHHIARGDQGSFMSRVAMLVQKELAPPAPKAEAASSDDKTESA